MAQPVILFHFMLHNSIRTFFFLGGGEGFSKPERYRPIFRNPRYLSISRDFGYETQ